MIINIDIIFSNLPLTFKAKSAFILTVGTHPPLSVRGRALIPHTDPVYFDGYYMFTTWLQIFDWRICRFKHDVSYNRFVSSCDGINDRSAASVPPHELRYVSHIKDKTMQRSTTTMTGTRNKYYIQHFIMTV